MGSVTGQSRSMTGQAYLKKTLLTQL
jgi:hypothetical protein